MVASSRPGSSQAAGGLICGSPPPSLPSLYRSPPHALPFSFPFLLAGSPVGCLCFHPLPPHFSGLQWYPCLNILITTFNYVNPWSHFPSWLLMMAFGSGIRGRGQRLFWLCGLECLEDILESLVFNNTRRRWGLPSLGTQEPGRAGAGRLPFAGRGASRPRNPAFPLPFFQVPTQARGQPECLRGRRVFP